MINRELSNPKVFFQLKREVRLLSVDKKVRVETKYKNEASEQAQRIDVLIKAQRKRKNEEEEKWAENREDRVGGWRKFNDKKSSKKKAKKGEFEFS
jgi:DnaJ family protein C protein 8